MMVNETIWEVQVQDWTNGRCVQRFAATFDTRKDAEHYAVRSFLRNAPPHKAYRKEKGTIYAAYNGSPIVVVVKPL